MKCLAAFLGGAGSDMLLWNSALFYILHITPSYSNWIVFLPRFYRAVHHHKTPDFRLTNVIDGLEVGNSNSESEF